MSWVLPDVSSSASSSHADESEGDDSSSPSACCAGEPEGGHNESWRLPSSSDDDEAPPPVRLPLTPAERPMNLGLRPVACAGFGIFPLVAQAACRPPQADTEDDNRRLFGHFFSTTAPPTLPLAAVADKVQLPRATYTRRLCQSAAAVHFGTGAWIASLFSYLRMLSARGAVILSTCMQLTELDETPLYHRAAFQQEEPPPPIEGDPAGQQLEHVRAQQQSGADAETVKVAQTCKIVQGRCHWLALLYVCATKRWQFWVIPLTAPLHVVDRPTGETLKGTVDQWWEVPMLEEAQADFKQTFDIYTADKAETNNRAIYGRKICTSLPPLREPCSAHITSTSQSRSCKGVDEQISGIISTSLSMKPGNALQKFRRQLFLVVYYSVVIVDAPAPPDDSPGRQRFAALLDAVIPSDSVKALKRRHELWLLFTSNTCEERIVFHNPGLLVGRWAWATRVAHALLPKKVPVFQRHRWLNSLCPLSEYSLLFGVHNLGQRTVPRWLLALKDKPLPTLIYSASWELSESESDDEPSSHAGGNNNVPVDGIDWAAFNKKHRKTTKQFAATGPGGTLIVARLAMQVNVDLLHYIEHLGSMDWEKEQMTRFIERGVCSTRHGEVQAGIAEDKFLDDVEKLMWKSESWQALAPQARTPAQASLAFSMLSSSVCSTDALLFGHWKGNPYQVWSLLTCEPEDRLAQAEYLLNLPPCMRDPWTEKLLELYPTAAALCSVELLSLLLGLGVTVHLENCYIECLNALLRRLSRMRSQTHTADIQDTSAEFVLRQQANAARKIWTAQLPRGQPQEVPDTKTKAIKRRLDVETLYFPDARACHARHPNIKLPS